MKKKTPVVNPRAFFFEGSQVLVLDTGHWRPVWSMVYSPVIINWEMGTKVYPSWIRVSKIEGSASGVWRAALWNRTIEPGCTLLVTRFVISLAEISFQSRLSPYHIDSRDWGARFYILAER